MFFVSFIHILNETLSYCKVFVFIVNKAPHLLKLSVTLCSAMIYGILFHCC